MLRSILPKMNHISEAEIRALHGRDMDTVMEVLIEKINLMADAVAQANNRAVAAENGLEHVRHEQQQRGALQAAQIPPDNGREQREQTQFTRALSSLPKFNGKTPWREWEVSFLNWMNANFLNDRNEGDIKNAMLLAFKEEALRRITPHGRGTPSWNNNPRWEDYLRTLRGAFEPESESDLSKIEFRARKQGKNENVSTFLNSKYALFVIAYPEGQYETLLDEVISGLYNPVVKRQVRRARPGTQEELTRIVMETVAAERISFLGGYAESSNLDGLASVTVSSSQGQNSGEEPMDCSHIQSFSHQQNQQKYGGKFTGGSGQKKDTRLCNRCSRPGHFARDCYAKKGAKGQVLDVNTAVKKPTNQVSKAAKGACFKCGKDGHQARHCRQGGPTIQEVQEENAQVPFLGIPALETENQEW